MNWIEVMGPAGIGKSTFLENQKNYRRSINEWLTTSEGINKIVAEHLEKKGFQKLLQLYLKQRLFKFKKSPILKYLYSPNQEHLQFLPRYESLASSYLDWYYHNFNAPATEKFRRISIYKNVISEMCLFDHYLPDRTIIMDEGPFNLHPNLTSISNLQPFCRPRLVLFCHLDVQENVRRIRQREEEGRLAVSHRGLNDNELKNVVIENHKAFSAKRNFLINQNIQFLDIDLTKAINKPIDFTCF